MSVKLKTPKLKPNQYFCAICAEVKPDHNCYLRTWDIPHKNWNADDRIGISKKVLICRMCLHKMKRQGYQNLGVLHYRNFIARTSLKKGRTAS